MLVAEVRGTPKLRSATNYFEPVERTREQRKGWTLDTSQPADLEGELLLHARRGK